MPISSYLQSNGSAVSRSYQHASRLYIGGGDYAHTPKVSWIYYVVFDIDTSAAINTDWLGKLKHNEVGLMVKNVELPKYQIATEVINQYNRKTLIQKNITYQTVSFAFHDDNSNIIHNLWLNYFKYYYNDSNLDGTGPLGTARDNPTGAYSNNKYNPSNDLFTPTDYGLNSGRVDTPFFRSITLYQLNRQIFTSYQLINPIIKSWEHDKLDQTQGNKIAESKMQIDYETVFYGTGQVKLDNPTGFADLYYDNTPSPLSVGSKNGSASGVSQVYGQYSGLTNPDSQLTQSDVLNSLLSKNQNNLLSNTQGVRQEVGNSNGYSTLNNPSGIIQSSLNGLGINLNLNLGNNNTISGQIEANQISALTGSGLPQDLIGGTYSQDLMFNGTPPISSDPSTISADFLSSISDSNIDIADAAFTQSTFDETPDGFTVASGNYFNVVQPLADSSPYTASNNIDINSDPADVQTAINDLSTSWSNDNDFVASQTLDPADVQSALNQASSAEEFAAIQNEAIASYAAVDSLQTTVDSKYSDEYTRLNTIQTLQQTDVSGSSLLASDTTLV